MQLLEFIFKQSLKIKVLHTLPGRLRVHIPLLQNVTNDLAPAYETIEELLFTIPGINSVSPNYISGNILIKYQQDIINTPTILSCIKVIWNTMVTNRRYFNEITEENADIITKKLINYIKKEKINLTNIIGEVRIPDEIWK